MQAKIGVLILLACLAACTSPGGWVPEASTPASSEPVAEPEESLPSLASVLRGVDRSELRNSPQLANRALQSAVAESDWRAAEQLLSLIDPRQLGDEDYARYALAGSRLHLQRLRLDQADQLLHSTRLSNHLPLMRLSDQIALSDLRARLLLQRGKYLASARERIYIEALIEDESRHNANARATWYALTRVPADQLKRERKRSRSDSLSAWIDLALIHLDNQSDPGEQAARAEQWFDRFAGHSAAQYLPQSIDALTALESYRPGTTVAALLPLSGRLARAGRAIQDGIAAAYFQARQQGWELPALRFYDSQGEPIDALLERVRAEGAQFVIGPLEKDQVNELLTTPTTLPILTLNYVTNGMPAPTNVIQFGLASEDEAMQLAQVMRDAGHQRVLILRSSADWARRSSQSFSASWQQRGGYVISETVLASGEDYSAAIAAALSLPASQARHRRLQQSLGARLEFTPRRRQDIDAILLLANPSQARTIKPLLAYHYAGRLPVFASSQVYDGQGDNNRDLNGITFNEMPWVLEGTDIKRQAASRYREDKQLGRLFAMGADAFFLHPRLLQPGTLPVGSIQGHTGLLGIEQQRITRQLLMARFSGGKAQPIED